ARSFRRRSSRRRCRKTKRSPRQRRSPQTRRGQRRSKEIRSFSEVRKFPFRSRAKRNVAFRSATGRSVAERKTTSIVVFRSELEKKSMASDPMRFGIRPNRAVWIVPYPKRLPAQDPHRNGPAVLRVELDPSFPLLPSLLSSVHRLWPARALRFPPRRFRRGGLRRDGLPDDALRRDGRRGRCCRLRVQFEPPQQDDRQHIPQHHRADLVQPAHAHPLQAVPPCRRIGPLRDSPPAGFRLALRRGHPLTPRRYLVAFALAALRRILSLGLAPLLALDWRVEHDVSSRPQRSRVPRRQAASFLVRRRPLRRGSAARSSASRLCRRVSALWSSARSTSAVFIESLPAEARSRRPSRPMRCNGTRPSRCSAVTALRVCCCNQSACSTRKSARVW